MAASSYDTIVIGSGPGGYVAAIRAAQLGRSTAVVERDKVGGRCLNYACIPAKAVLRSADLLSEIRDGEEFGLKVGSVEVDYAAIQARREKVVSTLTSGVGGLFKKNGIELIEGDATLTAEGQVRVGDRMLASAFARLGSQVILLEALERVLPTEDADISRLVDRGLKRQGIAVHVGTPVADVQASEDGVSFTYGGESARVDYLVIAAGRGADVEALGLAEAG